MIRFELCYRLADTDEYIAPELLSAKKPDFGWNRRGNLEFEYRYTFMPAGIMTRFIARNHVRAWDRSRALVTAEPFDSHDPLADKMNNRTTDLQKFGFVLSTEDVDAAIQAQDALALAKMIQMKHRLPDMGGYALISDLKK